MKKAKPQKRKKRLTQYHEDVYMARLRDKTGPLPVLVPWSQTICGFMTTISLAWIDDDNRIVLFDHQSLN